MLNRLLSPFSKTKTNDTTTNNQPNKDEQSEQQTNYSITIENNMTKIEKILYTMPRIYVNEGDTIFHPQNWNISMFEIGRPLGRGKFGHVYLARERTSKYIVAIKIINSEVIGQIRRQIQIHTHLNHPNILKMHGFFFDSRKIYYIMQYAPGGQLYKQLKKNKKFEEAQVSAYINQMTKALIHIHKCNVFHRDIKPQNILICANNQLKISDFGWSVRALTTQRKTMCGTMDYLCPEIIQNKFYDWSVDVWALGVLTYELATGSAPFYNKDRQQQYKNIRNVNISYPEYLSAEIVDFISKLLQKNPANRMSLQKALNHPFLAMYNPTESK